MSYDIIKNKPFRPIVSYSVDFNNRQRIKAPNKMSFRNFGIILVFSANEIMSYKDGDAGVLLS